jgi:hypothetical protein
MNHKIIGISGVAGSGKDTFYELLSERIPCQRFSLADELKKEVNQWGRLHYNIDSVCCSREEKEIIRPFLVFHGTTKRHASEGRYWIEKLSDSILNSNTDSFKIITDIRYDDYENDEVSWLKDELGGVLVHVSQYTNYPDSNEGALLRRFREPVNSEEARNDPKLKEKSDFQIEWEFLENGQIYQLSNYIDNFVNWLSQEYEKRAIRYDFNKESQG